MAVRIPRFKGSFAGAKAGNGSPSSAFQVVLW
jgi:hypothetical protein